jgi:hypothetical protein
MPDMHALRLCIFYTKTEDNKKQNTRMLHIFLTVVFVIGSTRFRTCYRKQREICCTV